MQVACKKVWQGEVDRWERQESSEWSQRLSIFRSRQGQGGKPDRERNTAIKDRRKCKGKKYGP